MAGLVLRVASRALPRRPPSRPEPVADEESLIEAIMTGDTAALAAKGPALATASDAMGNPWFFVALESGSLAALGWFLGHGASPTAPDRAGRLPLQALIERAALADDFDDHRADLPAMAAALIAAGADPSARSLTAAPLSDLAATAGLSLSAPPADKG